MVIYPSSRTRVGAEIQISAHIELRLKRRNTPSELWFRFPESEHSQISSDLDPFVVAVLLLAMQNNEPIEVRGSLSRKLFLGLKEYQQIYHSWFPERFHIIEIQPEKLRDDRDEEIKAAGCAFSGGVDSFYTLLTLLDQSNGEKSGKLTHAIFMAGFDMPLHLTASIRDLTQSYAEMMISLGIHFVIGSTNVRRFVNSVDWTNAHGQALVATALFFKNTWKEFYIPSSYTGTTYPKWGSHPRLDPLLSTESLKMIHHGSQENRVSKLESISQAPESYERLRVCWIQDLGLKNCGKCEKCIRTMVALDILEALPYYRTFTQEGLSRSKVRNLTMRNYQSRLFAWELMGEAILRGKFRIVVDLGYSLLRRELFYWLRCVKMFIFGKIRK